MLDWLFQYILGYCTSWGLAAIGEPPLTEFLPLAAVDNTAAAAAAATQTTRDGFKEPTPAWIIPIFMALVAGRYITSFLVSFYFYFLFFSNSSRKKKKKKKKTHIHTHTIFFMTIFK